MIRRLLFALPLILAVPAMADPAPVAPAHEWPFAQSDLPADPEYRFGRLDNGMRYVIRANGTPKGTGMVQFWVDSGSIAETEDERGYAHFIEHMAFNGSTHVPEGEMVKLLEREGLAFGADTNASTNFDVTLYKLDLPRNDPGLLDTALMLMRETASELTFNPDAIDREKGVVLSEMRVRDTYQLRDLVDNLAFLYPGAKFADRIPIGTTASLQGATAEKLRGLYQRLYRPENTAIVVVGDFDPDAVETAIREHFSSWQAQPVVPRIEAGPVRPELAGQTDIYLDPALSEEVAVSRNGPWIDHHDTLAFREKNVRRQLAYGIINRRLQRLARGDDAPFRAAAFSTDDLFETGRTTTLTIQTGDGEWRAGLAAAQRVYRQAMEQGFTEAEVAEQVANLRTALENNVAGADTRGNGSFVTGALTLLQDGQVPTTPASALERFLNHLPEINPGSVLAALKEEAVPLDSPMIRFEGRTAPEGGEAALRTAWDEGMAATVAADAETAAGVWDYTDFGTTGLVTSDTVEPKLGIRTLTFANGLRLNLKHTDLAKDRVHVRLSIDGGNLLNTRADPLATAMVGVLPFGGLGKLTIDDLQTVLAGHSVGFGLASDDDAFVMNSTTTPRDLELQLQVYAAAISDPGYRTQAEAQYRRSIEAFFASIGATPDSALSNALGGIVSDGDPRFSLQSKEAYLARSFAKLRDAIGDRLDHGALELAIVGDFDEQHAIDLVADTLGALPQREAAFRGYVDNRQRSFTSDRTLRVIRHNGAANQAIVRMDWPTRDDSDFDDEMKLELLERVVRIELTDTLREQLGQTYSPGVSANQSDIYPGYGTFAVAAPVDTGQVDAARTAILDTIRSLVEKPVDDDVLLRARQPMLEAFDNALKSNGGWMALANRAQSKPDDIARFVMAKDKLTALTPADIQAMAARYLKPDERLETDVLPAETQQP